MSDAGPKKRKSTPIWMAIAHALREDIAEARYKTGDKLPTEAELSARFGVNRHTVRHALSDLVREGLVHTRRGSGAFVTARPTDYAIGRRVRFHENLRAGGHLPEKRILSTTQRLATNGEAQVLKIDVGRTVLDYHGLSLSDGHPIALFHSVFPIETLPGIEAALHAHSSVTKALQNAGVQDYTRASTRLTAVRADAAQALHLRLREGDPLLRSSGVNVDINDRPVEFGRTWFAGDRVTLTLDD